MSDAPWVDVVESRVTTKTKVVSSSTKQIGRVKVTRVTTEVIEEPYMVFSCGHQQRAVDFDAMGKKGRNRVRCWRCQRESEDAVV